MSLLSPNKWAKYFNQLTLNSFWNSMFDIDSPTVTAPSTIGASTSTDSFLLGNCKEKRRLYMDCAIIFGFI
jgi:hypothetical protein